MLLEAKDLEAKDLGTLEDYRLVAKTCSPQQPGGPKGAGGLFRHSS